MPKNTLKQKLREWLGRYLPAEIIATITAITGAFIVHSATDSLAAAAIAGTISENIGYYGYFAVREVTRHYANNARHARRKRIILTAYKTIRDMLVEFGPAEFFDSFIFRPLFMYLGPLIIPNFAVGILAGKIAADLIFYTFAILGYEFRKRWS